MKEIQTDEDLRECLLKEDVSEELIKNILSYVDMVRNDSFNDGESSGYWYCRSDYEDY